MKDTDFPNLSALCKAHHIKRLDVFGSAARNDHDPLTSDFDFIVEFDDESQNLCQNYLAFADALEATLGRPVDLLTEPMIRNPHFRNAINQDRRTVYAHP